MEMNLGQTCGQVTSVIYVERGTILLRGCVHVKSTNNRMAFSLQD